MAENINIKSTVVKQVRSGNIRKQAMYAIAFALLLLIILVFSGIFIGTEKLAVNFQLKNMAPSWQHPFGTDWIGRDMLVRTIKGLTLSFIVGVVASAISVFIAVLFSFIASFNKTADNVITWLIDLFMSVPHLVALILISFALGGGLKGVVIGVALTHWPNLTRLLRAEVMQIQSSEYVAVSTQLGKSRWWIARNHVLPHLVPQLIVGFILLFPHAILHEAAITFLGFGLSSEQPAIGVILSESMRYLSAGMWWLAFFPGLALLIMVGVFDMLGRNLRRLIDPLDGQKL